MTDSTEAVLSAPDPMVLLQSGIAHYKAGELADAVADWREVLELAPGTAEAWHMLGISAGDCGDSAMAVELLRQAVALDPTDMRFHNNLANALRASGDPTAALASFRAALELAPESVEVLTNLGVALQELGDRDGAIGSFREAIALKPHFADAHFTLGNVLRQAGDLPAAEQSYRRAVAFRPEYAEAQYNLGLLLEQQDDFAGAEDRYRRAIALRPSAPDGHHALASLAQRQGRIDEAVDGYLRALRLDPERVDSYYDLGTALQAQGQRPAALECYRQALDRRPEFTDALVNLGALLHAEGRFREAEESLRRALAVNGSLVEAYVNLGNTLLELDDYAGAVDCYRTAIGLDPNHAEAHSNLGNVLHDLGDAGASLTAHRRALALKPELPEAHWNYALTLLSQGHLEEGWAEHEWRWRKPGFPSKRLTLDLPHWDGQPLAGRTILVWAEQGLGDEVMFASCIPDLVRSGARVILACTPKLRALFQRSFPEVEVVEDSAIAEGHRTVPADVQLPIGSLPRFLRRYQIAFPAQAGYLKPDPARIAHWGERLAALGTGLKVGISWRSRLMTIERRKFYTRLVEWQRILGTPGVIFVNLQYDECDAELAEAALAAGAVIHQPRGVDLFNDIDEVAALCGALDLVLAPDSSVGEVAAATGTDVWRLDAGIDWSTLGTERRPWQPSMRLFRKRPGTDWDSVIDSVAAALAARAREPQPSHSAS
jgi:tetratricopeptide (TPR) repeat protein